MPSELQTLLDIQEILPSLIDISISRQIGEGVTSLKTLNSWENIKIELEQLLLYMKLGENPARNNALHPMLLSIEGMVDRRVLGSSLSSSSQDPSSLKVPVCEPEPTTNYPKIKALMRAASNHAISPDIDLSSMIHLPMSDASSRKVENMVTDFNVTNSHVNEEPSTTVKSTQVGVEKANFIADSRPDQEVQKLEILQTSTKRLLNALVDKATNKPSHCKFHNTIRIHLRDPIESESILQYRLFFSSCPDGETWQETLCHVASDIGLAAGSTEPKPKELGSICKTIKKQRKAGRPLDLQIYQNCMYRGLNPHNEVPSLPIYPTFSLEKLLASSEDFSRNFRPADKPTLALNIFRALRWMYCSGVHVVDKEWKASDLYFLFDPNGNMVKDAFNPYLDGSLLPSQIPQSSPQSSPISSSRFPILVSSAKLLIEIGLGRAVRRSTAFLDVDLFTELNATQGPASKTIFKGEITKEVDALYVEAIGECLWANRTSVDDSSSDSDSDSDSDSESDDKSEKDVKNLEKAALRMQAEERKCKAAIVRVVAMLEAVWKRYNPLADLNLSHDFQISLTEEPRSSRTTLNVLHNQQSMSSRSPSAGPVNRTGSELHFFDDGRCRLSWDDKLVVWAGDFFDRNESFYTKYIQGLSNTSKTSIKVAILDTGVDQARTIGFWKAVKKKRSSNDYPIKETKSFIGGSAVDVCGHGTNVAGLVSKISPDADLYIAKISNGKEAPDGIDQIIEAIEWAQKFKVHIINMSFGFLRNDEIARLRKVIEKSELESVIFVASASNYGGNRSRTFPANMHYDRVICIHAADGFGNKSGMNPDAKKYDPNLSTLGVAVESIWPDDDREHLEGTSYAAPVASAIAANVLKFALRAHDPTGWKEEDLLSDDHVYEIFRSGGMSKILLSMTEHRDGYNFIAPWRSVWNEEATVRSVATRFKVALKE